MAQDETALEAFNEFWTKLMAKGKAQREQLSVIRGKNFHTEEFYKVVFKDDEPYRVIVVSISKNREDDLKDRLKIEIQSYIKEHGSGEEVTA